MKNTDHPFTVCAFSLVSLGLLALVSCEKPQKIDASLKPEKPSEKHSEKPAGPSIPDMVKTPVDRTITDNNGRSLEVRIIARSGTHVRMVRLSDGLKFDLPFAELSEDDRRFVIRIPETPYLGSLAARPSSVGREKRETPPYIKSREEAISRLEIKLQEQREELESDSSSFSEGKTSPRVSRMEKEVEKTNAEIIRLKAQIKVYRSQNKK